MPALRPTLLTLLLALGLSTSSGCGGARPHSGPPPSDTLVSHAPVRMRGKPASPKLRLPQDVKPVEYAVELTVRPDEPRFEGRVTMTVDLAEMTDVVWMHARGLTIVQAYAQVGDARYPLEALRGEEDFLGLSAPQPLPSGRARISVGYSGPVSAREVDGVFRVKEGSDWYVFTQFEPLAARTAFPCFDEPGFKTPWTLSITVPQGLPK